MFSHGSCFVLYDARGEKSLEYISRRPRVGTDSASGVPDQRGLGHTAGVAKVDDQREISTMWCQYMQRFLDRLLEGCSRSRSR